MQYSPGECTPDCRHQGSHPLPLAVRFWSKVRLGDSCWEWVGARNSGGYGTIGVGGRSQLAHRVSWMLHHGQPGNAAVLHHCDDPSCVRPDHLYLGDQKRNAEDREHRGRGGGWRTRGAGNGQAKLTNEAVAEIRALCRPTRGRASPVSQAALAEQFGVARKTISSVVRGTSWR